MKKKDVAAVTEVLSGLIEAGASAEVLLKAIKDQSLHKNKDFVMLFRRVRAWIESDKPEIRLTNPEKALLFTILPYVGWNNQIELLQDDMQALCGYQSRHLIDRLLSFSGKLQLVAPPVPSGEAQRATALCNPVSPPALKGAGHAIGAWRCQASAMGTARQPFGSFTPFRPLTR